MTIITDNKSYAPWTLEEVQSLAAYQEAGAMHPFTCPNRNDGKHEWDGFDLGLLIPTLAGWSCPSCGYTQKWAWEWMVDGTWKTFRWDAG